MKLFLCSALALVFAPTRAAAQARTDLVLGPLVSIQPVGYNDALPYLDHGVSGTQPGLAVAIQHRTSRDWTLGLEASSSRRLRVAQSGRLVFTDSGAPCGRFPSDGCGPAFATHRDTLVSGLVGKRVAVGGGHVELKLGPSLIFGKARQNDFEIEDAAGHVALTAGIDGAIRLTDRLELAPSFRYSRALRGDRDFYVGLGANIFRLGVGLRVWLSPR